MLSLNKKTVSIEKSLALSPQQVLRYKSLEAEADRIAYVLSILGKRTDLYLDAPKSGGTDKLANKRPGSVLSHFQRLLDNGSDMNHTPIARTKTSQWVGVEIECLIGDDSDCDDDECEYCGGSGEETCYNCEGNGTLTLEDDNGNEYEVDCRHCDGNGSTECNECDGSYGSGRFERVRRALRQAKVTNCSVRRDGSLPSNGVEITFLFDASKGYDKLQKLCKVLNDLEASVDSDCGLHIHLDHFNESRDSVATYAKCFERYLPMLSLLIPKSRRDNSYCRNRVSWDERYSAVNMTAFRKHKTIEVRSHSASCNAEKIQHWIELLIAVESKAKADQVPKADVETFQELIDSLELSEESIEYWDRRFQKFNPKPKQDPIVEHLAESEDSDFEDLPDTTLPLLSGGVWVIAEEQGGALLLECFHESTGASTTTRVQNFRIDSNCNRILLLNSLDRAFRAYDLDPNDTFTRAILNRHSEQEAAA